MMAKPMKTLELHYPMIQFLIISFSIITQVIIEILALSLAEVIIAGGQK